MKKCFWAPGRVIFLCNESGFCQRKEPAGSEDRRAVSFRNGNCRASGTLSSGSPPASGVRLFTACGGTGKRILTTSAKILTQVDLYSCIKNKCKYYPVNKQKVPRSQKNLQDQRQLLFQILLPESKG
ncbi:uncharacterized protein LOC130149097 isoform X4 [Falco biarmicus]|uniref:uncharacterized protein LOC106631504 isoform X4 n=1 Tax=Falco cherrug TaxID=345164 RepID=UPI00247847EA|nr:uncharacterized protein LOC106631504 isoform X4 [Falco cherrug]XP_055662688.1 uncharacterized protein LOC106112891 isoform X4 [Falco peregrinus]XP_056194368.1 uncharacterized protein LOC130149097 isoform X4 [Falco biarmicus]